MDNYESRINYIIEKYYPFIMANKSIVGIGYGLKVINGNAVNIPCLTVYVDKKASKNMLDRKNIIPQKFYGVLTDVIDTTEGDDNYMSVGNIEPTGGEIELKDMVQRPARGGHLIFNANVLNAPLGTLGIAVTEELVDTVGGLYNLNSGYSYMLSTARILTGNFKDKNGSEIMQKASLDPKSQSLKLGNLSNSSDVKVTKKGMITEYNEVDAAVGVVETIRDPSSNTELKPRDPSKLRLSEFMWNKSKVIAEKKYYDDANINDDVYILSKYPDRVIKGKLKNKKSTMSYRLGEDSVYFNGQFVVNIDIGAEHYGSLIFRDILNLKSDNEYLNPGLTHCAIGLVIGKVDTYGHEGKRVICTPITTVLKTMKKRIFIASAFSPSGSFGAMS